MATNVSPAGLDQRLMDLLTPVLADCQLELVDVASSGIGTSAAHVQVLVEHFSDHERGPRIDLDGVALATRVIDETLEAADPIVGAYTLEVSSPGLERPLRIPAHYQRFIGSTVAVKTKPGTEGERRIEGRLERADANDDGFIVVSARSISYVHIEKARTVFVWGGQEKPTGKKGSAPKRPHPKAEVAQKTEAETAEVEAATAAQQLDKQVASRDVTDHITEETR
jgi:ribosome maturation factor RimP